MYEKNKKINIKPSFKLVDMNRSTTQNYNLNKGQTNFPLINGNKEELGKDAEDLVYKEYCSHLTNKHIPIMLEKLKELKIKVNTKKIPTNIKELCLTRNIDNTYRVDIINLNCDGKLEFIEVKSTKSNILYFTYSEIMFYHDFSDKYKLVIVKDNIVTKIDDKTLLERAYRLIDENRDIGIEVITLKIENNS